MWVPTDMPWVMRRVCDVLWCFCLWRDAGVGCGCVINDSCRGGWWITCLSLPTVFLFHLHVFKCFTSTCGRLCFVSVYCSVGQLMPAAGGSQASTIE